jgi:hypothetical protein
MIHDHERWKETDDSKMMTTEWSLVLLTYSLTQMTIVLLQDTSLTPSFFIPAPLLTRFNITDEKLWDYFPPPSAAEEDLEAGEGKEEDCAICMEPILLNSRGASGGKKEERESIAGVKSTRYDYMVRLFPPSVSFMAMWLIKMR